MATNAVKQVSKRVAAHKKAMLWSVLVIVLSAMVLPLGGYVYVGITDAQAAWQNQDQNPRADYWGSVRRGSGGYSTAEAGPDGQAAGILIQNGGQNWRQIRNGPVANIMPWFMLAMLVAIVLFHLIMGRSRLKEPRSGRTMRRWSLYARTLHWYTAILFILMAITGLSLLFGRAVIMPWLGKEGFAAYAMFAKYIHNFLGPLFTLGVLLIILSWMRWNLPSKVDWQWFKAFLKKGEHAPAGRMNGGEKGWFWVVAIFGAAVCVTGLIMDFPGLGQGRGTMQVANVIHSVVGILWISILFGHIYIGTLGTEGALEGMTTGDVSEEWAKQHHDLWYEEEKGRQAAEGPVEPAGPATPTGTATPPGS